MEKKPTTPAAKAAAPKTSSGGLNPLFIIPILAVISYLIWQFVMGAPDNFEGGDNGPKGHPLPGNYLAMIYKGGFVVPVLMTCAATVIVFFIERFITIARAGGSGNLDAFTRKIKGLVDQNNIADAVKECDKQKGSVGNVVKTALHKYSALTTDASLDKEQKLAALQKEVDEATSLELPMLEKNMSILSTLASVSTLIALLGTVLGMIRAFAALGAGGGAPDAAALSTGISEALINTALGIGTSAVAILFYNYFTSKIDGLTYKIDEIGMSLQQNFAAHH
jgi:biopolymer transport protein ExbB